MQETDMDLQEFRRTLGTFMTGVTIVTTINEHGEPIGFTANSFTSVSLDPPLVLVCLAKRSANCTSFSQGNAYAINILAENQEQISGVFASPVADRYAGVGWDTAVTGSPILDGVAAWLDCSLYEVVDAGDHLVCIGQVRAFKQNNLAPLGYLKGNYIRISLGQEAAAAMENPHQKTSIGIIVENNRAIFMRETEAGLQLPQAPRLGNKNDAGSLLGLLNKLGIYTDSRFLFSVFENKKNNALLIYYRALLEKAPNSTDGRFYPFDKISSADIAEETTAIMLNRYIRERQMDAFGIYVGNEKQGDVESLATREMHRSKP